MGSIISNIYKKKIIDDHQQLFNKDHDYNFFLLLSLRLVLIFFCEHEGIYTVWNEIMINGRHENPRMNNFFCYSLLIRLRVSSVIESSVQNFNSLQMYGYFWTCTYRSFFFPTTRVINFHFHVQVFYCSFYFFMIFLLLFKGWYFYTWSGLLSRELNNVWGWILNYGVF